MFDEERFRELLAALENWEEETLAEWLEDHPEQKETFETLSGYERKRLYSPEDIEGLDYENDLGFPGEPPFTRGPYPTMYRGRHWTHRQIAGFETANETNQRYEYLLEQGQTGLSTDFDHPTLTGYDSDDDHSEGEVGRIGVAIDTLADFEDLFEDIPLEEVSTSMTINSPAPILLAFYVALADNRSVDRDKLRGTIQNSIFKEFIAQKTYALPPRPNIKLVEDVIEYCTEEVPNWYWANVSGYHTREAGGTAAQEAAFTLAAGMGYVEAGIEQGLDPDDFAPRMSFFFVSQTDFFEEIAKFRTVRRIWARVMKQRYGADTDAARRMRYHVQTAGESLTAKQPMVNIVRTTIQALAAVLGGCQSLHTNGYDEALSIPSEDAMRIALRTQQVIAHESGVTDTIDPLGGSYYIEASTVELEERVLEYLAEIEEIGDGSMKEGMLRGIENGYFEQEIVDSSYQWEKRKAEGDLKKVGVNCHTEGGEDTEIELFQANPETEERQKERLKRVKENRDDSLVEERIAALSEAVETGENIMPYLVDAAKAYATEGEMMGVLRKKYGTYEDPGVF
ncbi:acyl-CoA mutase large subunit family protein [Haladaptatus halobius]|uniref:acyl-CoA mutase large subunit family protein n=1 Tax=Haladaptatus halobius TaxID=2884875 RepID=UPI001D0AEAC0|nr:methylmalonyl-CoA mutase family protein [Haladaptatus halobius]